MPLTLLQDLRALIIVKPDSLLEQILSLLIIFPSLFLRYFGVIRHIDVFHALASIFVLCAPLDLIPGLLVHRHISRLVNYFFHFFQPIFLYGW